MDAYIAVSEACTELGASEELSVWFILEYATHKTQAHCDRSRMKDNRKFAPDSTLFECKLETDKSFLRQIIYTMIDTWFNTSVVESQTRVVSLEEP